ncbi:MAG: DUF402 domain-containing protein [Chloroflexi bacterium]|nr:DUF402 domain-containing protein [Chloroflexota bacterium]
MPRNGGATVDTARSRVLDRNGVWYDVESLAVSAEGLYYTRPLDGNRHFWRQERWVLPAHGWVVNRFAFHPGREDAIDWYIETDIIRRTGPLWRIEDGFLDVFVNDGRRYHVDDAGELADAIEDGSIRLDEALAVLRSFDALVTVLRHNGCSGAAVLREYAPSLPASMIDRRAGEVFVYRG